MRQGSQHSSLGLSMAAPASVGLLLLASDLEAGGQWPGAARCYEAVLKAGGQLPQAEAQTRLRLARLLLRHTHNVHEARSHLERAVRCCRSMHACQSLQRRSVHEDGSKRWLHADAS